MLKKFSQRAQWLAAFAAIVFSLSLVSEASAAALVNGDFEQYYRGFHTCSTAGWSEVNDVTAVTAGSANLYYDASECVAKIHSLASRGANMADGWKDESTISQTFDVPTTNRTLIFNAFADSQSGYAYYNTNQGSYLTQWIGLYDPNGVEIYRKGRNTYGRNLLTFAYSLPTSYTYSQITLRVWTVTSSIWLYSPDWATLYLDKVSWGPGVPFGTNQVYW